MKFSTRNAVIVLMAILLQPQTILASPHYTDFGGGKVVDDSTVVDGTEFSTGTDVNTSVPGTSGDEIKRTESAELAQPIPASLLGATLAIPVVFSSGSWAQSGETRISPCGRPKSQASPGPQPSEVRLVSQNGKVLGSRKIGNARIHLPEDGRTEWAPAERAESVLRVEFDESALYLELWEDTERQSKPSLVIDVSKEIQAFVESGMIDRAVCDGSNPPLVRLGDTGLFVLANALQRAADVSGLTPGELVEKMAGNNGRLAAGVELPKVVSKLLKQATIAP